MTTVEWERVIIPRGRRSIGMGVSFTGAGISLGQDLRQWLDSHNVERIDVLISKDRQQLALRPNNQEGAYSIKSNSIAQGKASPLHGMRGLVHLHQEGDLLVGRIERD